MAPRVAIIGAGLAGLTCARELARVGVVPEIFDKGRGLGGRLSTRRAEGRFQFDHGAKYLTARSDGFASLLHAAERAGSVAQWTLDRSEPAFVGVPGMTGIAKYLAHGLNIRKGVRITRILRTDGAWQLEWDGGAEVFDRVVLTAPAPQTFALLPEDHPFRDPVDAVDMDPCLALMIGLPPETDVPFTTQMNPTDELSWVALDSSKPERPEAPCLVAHASLDWSRQYLELDMHEIAENMLPLASEVLGTHLTGNLPYVSAHRWRYALVSTPLGRPCLADQAQGIFAGGDWCLGTRAEDAWRSGIAIASALIETL
ncbi:MAG: FAD-dependent oxidoreductase [Pseudomonadota bacterium]